MFSQKIGTYYLLPCINVCVVHRRCAVHQGYILSTLGDIMSTLEVFSAPGRYHEYTGEYHDKCGGRSLGKQLNLYGNPSVPNISRCTFYIPQCTEHAPVHCTEIMQGVYYRLYGCVSLESNLCNGCFKKESSLKA